MSSLKISGIIPANGILTVNQKPIHKKFTVNDIIITKGCLNGIFLKEIWVSGSKKFIPWAQSIHKLPSLAKGLVWNTNTELKIVFSSNLKMDTVLEIEIKGE